MPTAGRDRKRRAPPEASLPSVTTENIRILSDMHYGDRASRVRSLAGLRPLFEGADRIVFNGDSIETRAGANPRLTARLRRRFVEFVRRELPQGVVLTGNHDADISDRHHLDLLGGLVFVTHGEVLFDDLVPWSAEQPRIIELYRRQLARLSPAELEVLESRLGACKRACAELRLLHDPLPRGPWRRTARLVRIFWPPRRALAMVRAWRELPERVAAVVHDYRPAARFAVVGHTHLPGVWIRDGVVVINTGSFTPPLGGYAVDVSPERVMVRRIRHRDGRFTLGRTVATFALASSRDGSRDASAAIAGLAPAP